MKWLTCCAQLQTGVGMSVQVLQEPELEPEEGDATLQPSSLVASAMEAGRAIASTPASV